MRNDIPPTSGRRRSLRRRCSAGVVWAVGTIVALQLAFHYPCSYLWPELCDHEYGPKLTRLQTLLHERAPEQPLVLAFGNSLISMGVRPGELLPAMTHDRNHPLFFNFGIKGRSIMMQSLCLQRLLREGIHPDLVLLQTYPPFFLSSERTDPRKIEHIPSDRLHWQDLSLVTAHHFDPHRVRKEWREGQCFPWYFHRNLLMNWYLPDWVPKNKLMDLQIWQTDEWGWDCCPKFYEKARKSYRTPEYYTSVQQNGKFWAPQEINEELHQILCDLLSLCTREKIRAMVVWPPEDSAFRKCHSAELSRRYERWFERVRNETGTALLNARDWLADDDFADGLHLTPEGATHFTQKLAREVLNRW